MNRIETISARCFRTLGVLLGCAAVALGVCAPSAAVAGPLETRVGQQYLTAGFFLQPGFVNDPTVPTDPNWNENAATVAGVGRVGLQHVMALPFTMGLEIDVGSVWYDEHTLDTTGAVDSETALVFGVGLTGRWFPLGEAEGPSVGFGAHARWDLLADVTYNTFAPHLRLGWAWWQADSFLQLEVGYSTPVIAGLNVPTDFTGEGPELPEQDSRLHTFSIGFNVGF
jgi:hypothetical protein